MASFERATKANANFRVRLSRRGPWYYGEPITGYVTMDVKDIFYMRGLLLVLRGTQSCSIMSTYVPFVFGAQPPVLVSIAERFIS